MAWSEAARRAAAEARRRKSKMSGVVKLTAGKQSMTVPRGEYAQRLRSSRQIWKRTKGAKKRNRYVRAEAKTAFFGEGH